MIDMGTIDLLVSVGLLSPFIIVGVGILLGLVVGVANITSGFLLGLFMTIRGYEDDEGT